MHASGVVTMPFSVRDGINIFLAAFIVCRESISLLKIFLSNESAYLPLPFPLRIFIFL